MLPYHLFCVQRRYVASFALLVRVQTRHMRMSQQSTQQIQHTFNAQLICKPPLKLPLLLTDQEIEDRVLKQKVW